MNALIVHAHPEPLSMNAALTATAVDTLRAHGYDVTVSDLYRQGFQAVAGTADFTHPVHPGRLGYVHEQRHATAHRHYARDILQEQDKVARADMLIFQFPLWWYSVPAILKGWADRVLTHGFAYTDERLFESGLLAGKRAMLSLTTGGTAQELAADRRHTGTVEEFLRPFNGGVLAYTGMEVLSPFIAYAPASLGEEGRHGSSRNTGAILSGTRSGAACTSKISAHLLAVGMPYEEVGEAAHSPQCRRFAGAL